MSPSELEQKVVKAASWMFKREKSKDFWWNPGVLTDENPDKTNPRFSRPDAEEVFEELRKRGLFENRIITQDDINNGEPFLIYKINENRKKEWTDIISETGFWKLSVIPWSKYLFGASYPLLKGIGYAMLLAFATKFAQNVADSIWVPPTTVKLLQENKEKSKLRR